ncbi:MAG: DNA-protecting protein DprA [Candidatus Liptonbacteria bacterium]|nr:DNA-protecting protein DprA [Candidatus Liptonbacteria bacterium]
MMYARSEGLSEHSSFHAASLAVEGDLLKLRKLKERLSTWKAAWEAIGAKGSAHTPEAAWEKLARAGITLFLHDDQGFPPLLRELSPPPLAIYVRGALPPSAQPALAIVGTRRATRNGKDLAHELAKELAPTFSIVSGLALGVDAAAHAGCLEGGGRTVAVLAGGVDTPQPQTNAGLAARILERGGALVSEYPPGSAPIPYRFLERNRIVSGLSQGAVIVEAPEGSGALVTARCALEQNREVFVLPGPVTHPNFRGSHALIREGARLVRTAGDILEDLGYAEHAGAPAVSRALPLLDADETAVVGALRAALAPLSVDSVIGITALTPSAANRALSFLLLKNVVQETEGGYALRSEYA